MPLLPVSPGLHARSVGLNQRYRLGAFKPNPVGGGGRAPGVVDPYGAIIGGLPRPLTNAQITAQAQGQLSPLVAAVTKTIGGQTQAAQNAIRGFSGDAAAKLAAIDWNAPYAGAEQGQAAVDAALRQSLAGAGQSGADELAQRLGVINDPTVGAASAALAANGADNGTTQVAQGSASLGNLLADAAGAQSYGQKLPGIQRLAGLQGIEAAGAQGQAQIAAQAQALEAQLPSIIQGLQARNDNRSQALAAARENQLARRDAIGAGQASSADKRAALQERAAATTQTNQTRLAIAQANAQGKASAAQVSQGRSDRTYRLQFAKTFGYDPATGKTTPGYEINAHGQVVKVSSARGRAAPRLSAKQRQDYMGTAATIAENAHNGFTQTDSKGVVTNHPAIGYRQALDEMDKEGVPRPIAIQYLNRWYPAGTPAKTIKGSRRKGDLGVQVAVPATPGERG